MKRLITTVIATLVVLALAIGAWILSGTYNIGADAPHWPVTYTVMQTLRERSIDAYVAHERVTMPNLEDPQIILKGAGQYAAMCTGCHLAPGMKDSEIRPGLYPEPPNLSQQRVEPKEAFWVIKHGVKMSAMPAWGLSHDDATIWSMVAFLQKLPGMTPEQYKKIVAQAPPDEDMDMDMGDHHEHAHGDEHEAPAPSASAAPAPPSSSTSSGGEHH